MWQINCWVSGVVPAGVTIIYNTFSLLFLQEITTVQHVENKTCGFCDLPEPVWGTVLCARANLKTLLNYRTLGRFCALRPGSAGSGKKSCSLCTLRYWAIKFEIYYQVIHAGRRARFGGENKPTHPRATNTREKTQSCRTSNHFLKCW